MPRLNDDMYCSQQICIPPMYPYVLRQFAKAAIRSQPPDLLRWSTAYFRCLALNLPPPVKPRLEYPVPRDYYGITPGWLKALMYQLQGSLTVSYKVLWDRWIGACLRHQTLMQILCLGQFTDPKSVPWFRFVGLCASVLTDNLTQTMILVCEILTEEPEGGSAMVPVDVFNDIYDFLASLDASKPQILFNMYFTDAQLGLAEEKPKEREILMEEEEVPLPEMMPEEEEAIPEEEEEIQELQDDGVISCPDIAADKGMELPLPEEDQTLMDDGRFIPDYNTDQDSVSDEITYVNIADEEQVGEEEAKMGAEEAEIEPEVEEEQQEIAQEPEPSPDDVLEEELPCAEEKEGEWQSKETLVPEEHKEGLDEVDTDMQDKIIYIDLGMVSAHREEEGMSIEEFGEGEEEAEEKQELGDAASDTQVEKRSDDFDIEEFLVTDEGKPEEIYIEAIPGIGARVPEEMVKAVTIYMLQMSAQQHGVVMPRNIRHYSCPPLEILPAV